MKIELLYFEGCPSWQTALENMRYALKMEGLDTPVELVQVIDNEDAAQKRFLGSPSFRINGVELWGETREVYSLSCRVYVTPDGMKGSPTVSMLREALVRSSQ
jgi:hypothetical protein